MAQPKRPWLSRIIEGKEKSEEYVRNTQPHSRWQLFRTIFKGSFGKLFKINLLSLIFFIPLIAVIVLYFMVDEANGVIYPFGANLGIGYPAAPQMQGVAEMLALQGSLLLYAGIFISSFVFAIGLAGGLYVIRKLVWTEGTFLVRDFWRGVKQNYKICLFSCLYYAFIFTVTGLLQGALNFLLALNPDTETWIFIIQALTYVFLALATIQFLWLLAFGINYKSNFIHNFRNSIVITVGLMPQSIFFGVLALLPIGIFLLGGSLGITLGVMIYLIFGLSYLYLVWMNFSQWAFDEYINPKVAGAKVGKGLFHEDGTSKAKTELSPEEREAELERQRSILAYGKSKLVATPVKPIDDDIDLYELPQAFSREDLIRLKESRETMVEDSNAYVEEHKLDERYVAYNSQFEERERALQDETDEKGKKKKRKPPKLLGQ